MRTKQFLTMIKFKRKTRNKMKRRRTLKISKPTSNKLTPKRTSQNKSRSKSRQRTSRKWSKARSIRTVQTFSSRCRSKCRNVKNRSSRSKTCSVKSRKRSRTRRWTRLRGQKWLRWTSKTRKWARKSNKTKLLNTFLTRKLSRCKANWQQTRCNMMVTKMKNKSRMKVASKRISRCRTTMLSFLRKTNKLMKISRKPKRKWKRQVNWSQKLSTRMTKTMKRWKMELMSQRKRRSRTLVT